MTKSSCVIQWYNAICYVVDILSKRHAKLHLAIKICCTKFACQLGFNELQDSPDT
eukprot:c46805_g1_i1 orf=124-288(+)